jgi:CRP/FNR family transcriptional regulator, anaerobic regulatory protein
MMQTATAASSTRTASDCETCTLSARGECPGGREFQGALLRRSSVKKIAAGSDLYSGDETPETVAVLRAGWAMQYARLRDGERQILTFLIPGDAFDQDAVVLPQTPSLYPFRALTDVTICLFGIDEYRSLLTSDVRSRRFAKRQIRRHQQLMAKHIIAIGRRRALARLVGLLLELHQRLSERGLVQNETMPFPLRQEDIADALGLTHAHVNRTLKSLREARVIEYDHGFMRILNLPALAALAPSFIPLAA